ncbi:hypothetical protein HZC34_07445 [Candidatus Saganbacteria bacterium]|nr:hypothetical protein [Candidatus Saganbacteria bacterium]
MAKEFRIIVSLGLAVISTAYIILYSPLSDLIFGLKNAQIYSKNMIPSPGGLAVENIKKTAKGVELTVSLKDPFSVPFAFEKAQSTSEALPTKEAVSLFKLQAVIFQTNGKPTAIIDDKMLYEGQKIYNWTVSRILSDKVLLVRGKNTKTLKLKLGVE